jgi:NAD+ synthetase
MRLALAQINPVVGDLRGNVVKHLDFIARARDAGAQLVVFPELSVIGYPPKDLLLKPSFIDENLAAVETIARACTGISAIVGYADRNAAPVGRPLHNAVAYLANGRVASRHFKTLLPTYDVFDESRYFEPGPPPSQSSGSNNLISLTNLKAGISICEDLWNDERLIARRLYQQNPIRDLHQAGADLLINASASPFVLGKHDFRLQLFGSQAIATGKPLVYVNQVGGNDELVFDGNSLVLNPDGSLLAQAKDFEEDLLVVDLPAPSSKSEIRNPKSEIASPPHRTGLASLHAALVLGLRDYVRKCGFKSVVLGLSGGIDSALTAALAADALGPNQVTGVAMPSRFSSDHSIQDAKILAQNLGIHFHLVPIDTPHKAYESTLSPAFQSAIPNPQSAMTSPLCDDLTEQNLQARLRGVILMAFSNRFNHLLLTTGNKSELATGYCTLYGDMCGGLAVISDVPKTTVWHLSRFHNELHNKELIPDRSITKVPSAELRPNQTDQDSLPPYDLLDEILYRYIEEEKGQAQIVSEGYDEALVARVIKLVDRSEYKRRQAAPGLKVTSRAFGFGRRMPIAQRYTPGYTPGYTPAELRS